MSATIITATATGINKEEIDKLKAATCSPVDTIAFPAPAVVLVEANRKKEVPACMIPAVPPPMIKPIVHFSNSLSAGITEVASKVPPAIASGAFTASKRLSKKGI